MTTKLQPFQKVLVRDSDEDAWTCTFFSHLTVSRGFSAIDYPKGEFLDRYPYTCSNGMHSQCIPYAGNTDLVGTTMVPAQPE